MTTQLDPELALAVLDAMFYANTAVEAMRRNVELDVLEDA